MSATLNVLRLHLALFAALLALLLFSAQKAEAHRPGESYVYLKVSEGPLLGEYHIRFSDLEKIFQLDGDGDGVISEAEVTANRPEIATYLTERLRFYDSFGSHTPVLEALDFFGPQNARQIQLFFSVPTLDPPPDAIDVEYRFLYDEVDPVHRPMLLQKSNTRMHLDENEWVVSLVFETGAERQTVDLQPPSTADLLREFIQHGFFQILLSPLHLGIALIALMVWIRPQSSDDVPTPQSLPRVVLSVGLVALTIASGFAVGLFFREVVHYRLTDVQNVALLAAALVIVLLDNIIKLKSIWRCVTVLLAGVLFGATRSDYGMVVGLNKGMPEIVVPGFAVGIFVAVCFLALVVLPGAYLLLRKVPISNAVVQKGSVLIAVGAVLFLFFQLALQLF